MNRKSEEQAERNRKGTLQRICISLNSNDKFYVTLQTLRNKPQKVHVRVAKFLCCSN